MAEYRGNSFKEREENKKPPVEKVTMGNVNVKKKSGVEKFISSMFAENLSNMKDYYVSNVVVPTIMRGLSDILIRGIEGIFGSRASGSSSDRVARYLSASERSSSRTYTAVSGNVFDYNNIEFADRGDAELVLDTLYDILDKYKVVSVSDFYDAAGVAGNATDTKWGWRSLNGARVVTQAGGGYMIKLPRATSID